MENQLEKNNENSGFGHLSDPGSIFADQYLCTVYCIKREGI